VGICKDKAAMQQPGRSLDESLQAFSFEQLCSKMNETISMDRLCSQRCNDPLSDA
jgi:hypothetical protein